MTDPRPVDPLIAALRDLRIKAGLTQEQVAEASGTSARQVCKVENGRQQPSLWWLRRIGQVLGVQPGWLSLAYADLAVDPAVARTLDVAEQTAAMNREAGR